MATVRTVTLPDGSSFTMSDWGDYPLWSRAEIAADGSQDIIIFNYTASQSIPGGASNANATLVDTNLPAAGQLPLRHQMVVFSVRARFDEACTNAGANGLVHVNVPGTLEAYQEPMHAEGLRKWNNIVSNMVFQFVVENTKPYVEGPLTDFPAGGGLWMIHGEETGSPTYPAYYINNGQPQATAARRLAMPIHLGALETFQGLLRLPRGELANWTDTKASSKTDYGVTITLNGPRQRPIG